VLRGAGIPDRPATWFADLLALVGVAQSVEDHLASTGDDPVLAAMGEYLAMLPPDHCGLRSLETRSLRTSRSMGEGRFG
jgi:hypothetical protein